MAKFEEILNRLTGTTIQTAAKQWDHVKLDLNDPTFNTLMAPITPDIQLACVTEFRHLTHPDRIPSQDLRSQSVKKKPRSIIGLFERSVSESMFQFLFVPSRGPPWW